MIGTIDLGGLSAQEIELFATSEGLRTVLTVIAAVGEDAWRTLPAADHLMIYTAHRYQPLAASWHREPWEAATAAYVAMRSRAVREAIDPWAVVTYAVERDLRLETAAERAITSRNRIKHDGVHAERIPVRAGEYESYLFDTLHAADPGLAVDAPLDDVIQIPAAYLAALGWRAEDAVAVVEYMCGRITDLGSLDSAIDTLQRDRPVRTLMGLTPERWAAAIRVLIGVRSSAHRPAQPGSILRVLAGASLPELLVDPVLAQHAAASVPQDTDAWI